MAARPWPRSRFLIIMFSSDTGRSRAAPGRCVNTIIQPCRGDLSSDPELPCSSAWSSRAAPGWCQLNPPPFGAPNQARSLTSNLRPRTVSYAGLTRKRRRPLRTPTKAWLMWNSNKYRDRVNPCNQINTYETLVVICIPGHHMVLVQGPARSRRSSPAWSYAEDGDNCVSQAVRAPSYVGRHSAPEQACSIFRICVSRPKCLRPRTRPRSQRVGAGTMLKERVCRSLIH